MMSEAKRYKFNSVPIVTMDGDWCRISDYEALEQELKEAKDKVSLSRGALMIEGAIDRAEKAEQENKRLREAIEWALGIRDEIPLQQKNEGKYWWRKELKERAGFIVSYEYDKETKTVKRKLEQ